VSLRLGLDEPFKPQHRAGPADRRLRKSRIDAAFDEQPRTDIAMIMVTRHNGSVFALNPDLIERVEANPDTVISLVGGTKYVVVEPLAQIIEAVTAHRAEVLKVAAVPVVERPRPAYLRSVSDGEG
jgi:flagellar protein FlbD